MDPAPPAADSFHVAADDPDYLVALETMRRVLGAADAERIERLLANGPLSQPIAWFFAKTWGALYARDDKLGLRERALLLIATDLALGRAEPLRDHLRVALHSGMTPDEIVEAMFHTAFYVGVPALAMGMRVAGELFAELGKQEGER